MRTLVVIVGANVPVCVGVIVGEFVVIVGDNEGFIDGILVGDVEGVTDG